MRGNRFEAIRELVMATLADLGIPDANWSLVTETSPFREWDHITERPRGHGVRVIWLVEAGAIEFYAESGEMLHRASLETERAEQYYEAA